MKRARPIQPTLPLLLGSEDGSVSTLSKVQESITDAQVIRVESVLSKMPIHTLSKKGAVNISIKRKGKNGDLDLVWDVSPSMKYGVPRILAYRIDTLVINKCIDEASRPLPRLLRLGSLNNICRELGMQSSGQNIELIKNALYQNAGAMIKAKISYKDKLGTDRRLEAGFTRYAIIFTGESLPDGNTADSVYIVLNDVYRDVLNEVPVRPLDFVYLKELTPTAQRFYEIVSFKMFAALRFGYQRASLNYSDYCMAAAQNRHLDASAMMKQMYKIHRPHLSSGYLSKVEYEPMLDAEGQRDWVLCYTPGAKAKTEYRRFNANREGLEGIGRTKQLPHQPTESEKLIEHFLIKRFGSAKREAAQKELSLADELIKQYELEGAKDIVDACLERAKRSDFQPLWLGGIQSFLPDVTSLFDRRVQAQTAESERLRAIKAEAEAESIFEKLSAAELQLRQQRAQLVIEEMGLAEILEDEQSRAQHLRSFVIADIAAETLKPKKQS